MSTENIEPPNLTAHQQEKHYSFRETVATPESKQHMDVGRAQIGDVQEILNLVNGYAASDLMLPRGPQYIYENIRDFMIAVDKGAPIYSDIRTRKVVHLLAACGSLHVLWDDMAEIRALAVHPSYQKLKIGSTLVETMIEDAKRLGIQRIYTFTLTESFFAALGFRRQKRDELPAKIWGECSRCPKYFRCDEVGMVLEL